MPLPPPFPCALGSCGAWAVYCAQPSSTQTSHWVPTFPSNASAHIPHLGSAPCFSKQYLCPPHSLSFPLPSAWLPLHLLVSLLSFFAAHSSFPLPRCSTNLSIPSPPTLYQCGDIPSMALTEQGTGQETSVSDNHVHARLSNPCAHNGPHRSPTVTGSQQKMVWSNVLVKYCAQPSAVILFCSLSFYSGLYITSQNAPHGRTRGESIPHSHPTATWYMTLKIAQQTRAPLQLRAWFWATFARSAPDPLNSLCSQENFA